MNCICEFCNKAFNTNSLLQRHIKTAKYCLELRREKKDLETVIDADTVNEDITKKFQCNSCMKEFTNKRNMIIHIENCKEVNVQKIKDNYMNELLEKDKELIAKEDVIKHLESKIKNHDNENSIASELIIKSDIIQKFKLTLEDNSIISIPVRSDGYVNVTALCKSIKKAYR